MLRSPFLSVYELEGREPVGGMDDPVREAYAALVDELHDEEFDEALHELQSHARAMHDGQLDSGATRAAADQLLTQHFSQLIRASETAVDAMVHEFGMRDEAGIVDHEIESFVASYAPPSGLEPEFEDFFGKLLRKVGKLAKSAVGTAWRSIKTLALGPIFNAIKAVLRPILNGVLQRAIGQLPAPVQPAAQKLAQKLGLSASAPAAAPPANAAPVQDAAGAGNAGPQQEFDEQFAGALLAQDEADLQLEMAQLRSTATQSAQPVFAELDDARERFIHELGELAAGENAEPQVQAFLPAVLPALRVGLRLAGRPRVVNFLAQMLAQLISRLIGPEQAPALSRAIVDAGFKLLNLEMQDSEMPRLAASAVAATVEDTIARVAALPEAVLDNEALLEGFVLEAFEQAAAANLPPLFSGATYRQRPELLEAGLEVGWVLLPLRGRKRYKRCTRVFQVRVSPYMAGEVESFEGTPLADYLQDQLGLPDGAEVQAQLNLYETLPGTSLADIARGEHETFGTGVSDEANAAQLHPLTPQAAAVLLGRPGLGRPLPASPDGQRLPAGQRLYHMAVPGQRPLTMPGAGPRHQLRRRLHVNVVLDRPRDRVRVCAYLSEVKAQKLAQRLRDPAALGALAAGFSRWMGHRLEAIFQGRAPRRLRVVHGSLRPGTVAAPALAGVPPNLRDVFQARLHEALLRGFAEFVQAQSARFLAAAEDASEGVTLVFHVEHAPGLKALLQALAERGVAVGAAADAAAAGRPAAVRVEVFPGHRCV